MNFSISRILRNLLPFALLLLAACGGGLNGLNGCGPGSPPGGIPLMGGAVLSNALNLTAVVSSLTGTANTAVTAGAADGAGTAASFNLPSGITTDGTNLYVVDSSNHKIRQIVIATGAVNTLAGSGTAGAADGVGTVATFNLPSGITTDGTNLYVTDQGNNKIRKIVIATSTVSTLAGSGTAGATDGAGTVATFANLMGITTDGTTLYVTDQGNNKIRQIVIATGVVSSLTGIANTATSAGAADGAGTTASFNLPSGITTDGINLYVVDSNNNKIRKIVIATGQVSSLTGTANTAVTAGAADGAGTAAAFNLPSGITSDGTNLYVMDSNNNKIRKIVIATGQVSSLTGAANTAVTAGAADGAGTAASFNKPHGITSDGTNLYAADYMNNKIRKIQ